VVKIEVVCTVCFCGFLGRMKYVIMVLEHTMNRSSSQVSITTVIPARCRWLYSCNWYHVFLNWMVKSLLIFLSVRLEKI